MKNKASGESVRVAEGGCRCGAVAVRAGSPRPARC